MSETEKKPRISFIGVGLMGSRMADRLLTAGFPVTVWNRSTEKCTPLEARGARAASSITDAVADAEIVITMLAGGPAIEDVYFGPDGVVPNAPKNCLLIDMSSLAPDIATDNHRRLTDAGYDHHLDALVSGGVSGAEAGTLSIMVGGDSEDLERARFGFEVMGNVFHIGEAGAGQVCKLVNQTIVHIFIGGVSEGLMLAASLGVDAGKVREAISGGYCQSRILEIYGGKMVDRDFVPGGPLEFSVKDLDTSVKMAREASLEMPLAAETLDRYRGLVASGRGRLDHSALLLAYEEANVPIRVSPGKTDKLP